MWEKTYRDSLSAKEAQKITWVLSLIEELEQVSTKYYKQLSNTDGIVEVRVQIAKNHYKVQILATFPQIGYVYNNEKNEEIRILLYGYYRIAYLVEEEIISILGVFHGALEIESIVMLLDFHTKTP